MADKAWWEDISGSDIVDYLGEAALMFNPWTAGASTFLSSSEANAGEDEAVAERNARWAALGPAEKKRILAERLSGPGIGESAPKISRAGVSQASPMPTREQVMGRVLAPKREEYPPQTRTPSRISRTGSPRSQASPMPTREDIISRLLAPERREYPPQTRTPSRISRVGTSKATPPPTAEAVKRRLLAPKRGEYPPQTAARTPPSRGLEFGDVKGLSPSNVRTTAARREAATLKNKVIADAARKKRAAEARKVGTMLEERQAAPSKADIRSGKRAEKKRKIAAAKKKRYQPRTASETAATREKRKAVGTMLKERQAKPSGEDIRVAKEAETKRKAAKEKARQASLEKSAKKMGKEFRQPKVTPISKPTPKVAKTEKKLKVVKKVAKKKFEGEPRTIAQAKKMGKKYFINKAGKKLAAVTKKDLADFRKKTGNPKATLTQLLNARRKLASPTEWKKKSARKTGGIVKKAGGGKMKQVGLHTAEMRSGGKDLHQPQSKIKKRIEEETRYAKKGGKVGKKKKKKVGKKEQGYKARKDESIAMRVKKKRTKKQLKASRDESYGKWGKGKGKGRINRKSSGASFVASLYD